VSGVAASRKAERIVTARLLEIEVLARKALDALWNASNAIACNSPTNRDFELRATRESLDRIIELSREAP